MNLKDAEATLTKATLTAPLTVSSLAYTWPKVKATGLAAELVDIHNLEVVLSVDEVDVGELAVGQPAIITLETWPDEEICGEIIAIAPKATAGNNAIVSYEVRLNLGRQACPFVWA